MTTNLNNDSTCKMEVPIYVCRICTPEKRKLFELRSEYSSMYVKFLPIIYNSKKFIFISDQSRQDLRR